MEEAVGGWVLTGSEADEPGPRMTVAGEETRSLLLPVAVVIVPPVGANGVRLSEGLKPLLLFSIKSQQSIISLSQKN